MNEVDNPAAATCPRCDMDIEAGAEFCHHCGAKVGAHKPVPAWHVHRRLYDWTLSWAYKPSAAVALFVMAFAESSFFPIPPDVLLMPLVLGNRKKWLRYATICSGASVLGAVAGFAIGMFLWGAVGDFFFDHVPGFHRDEVQLADGRELTGFVAREDMTVDGPFGVEPNYPIRLSGQAEPIPADAVAADGVKIGAFSKIGKMYERYNFWIVFTAGFTPIPFKVITITAGVFGTGAAVASPWAFFAVFLIASTVSRSARFFLVAGLMRAFGAKITPFIDKYFNWLALLFAALLIGGFVAFRYIH